MLKSVQLKVANLFDLLSTQKGIFSALVELTWSCPLRCAHCYLGEAREGRIYISTDKLLYFLNALLERNLTILTLTGGEPLVHPEVEEIFSWARKNGVMVRVMSSLTVFSREVENMLEETPVLEVETSLYSSVSLEHDAITGVKGSFEKTLKAISRLIEKKFRVNVKMPLFRENAHRLREVKELVESIGADFFANSVLLPCRDTCSQAVNPLSSSQLYEVAEDFPQLFEWKEVESVRFPLCNLEKGIYVAADGSVKRCMEHPDVLGNIYKDSPEKILNSEAFIKSGQLAYTLPKVCRDCNINRWCNMCPALVMKEEVRSQFCQVAEVKREFHSRQVKEKTSQGKR